MGFNKRSITDEHTIYALKYNKLTSLYTKTDCLLFNEGISLNTFELFKQGKTELEIIKILNLKI